MKENCILVHLDRLLFIFFLLLWMLRTVILNTIRINLGIFDRYWIVHDLNLFDGYVSLAVLCILMWFYNS